MTFAKVKVIKHGPACPYCGAHRSLITESRLTPDKTVRWRRRRCLSCFRNFVTDERVGVIPPGKQKTQRS